MAQLVARLVRNEKVRGSNPLSSTKEILRVISANARIARGIRRCYSLVRPADGPPVAPGALLSRSTIGRTRLAIGTRLDREIRWRFEDGSTMLGRHVELDPPRRVVMRHGWERSQMGRRAGLGRGGARRPVYRDAPPVEQRRRNREKLNRCLSGPHAESERTWRLDVCRGAKQGWGCLFTPSWGLSGEPSDP
ncbi:hypothetical protein PD653_4329 [Nocardioides sp. PD653]|nr:hypothetical protein PD653B2_3500 [Nocardioides sp. PD653-B2]GAW56889.1 hypothetical protein PD653_4329 [Nocardioides sp. PD653]